jgi:hypothetical protein
MTTTTLNLDNLTDAEIEKLKTEAREEMAKAYSAGGVLLATEYYKKFCHLSDYLRNRQLAKAFGKW